MPEIAEWVLYLHERWDGRGYPDKLEGEDIPLASRVLGVADAFEAMTSSRLYRRGMAVEKALEELEKSPGKQFDPTVAKRMVELVRAGAIPLGEIGVLDVTHYGSAAGSGVGGPARGGGRAGAQRAASDGVPRGARRAGRARAATPGRAPAPPADRGRGARGRAVVAAHGRAPAQELLDLALVLVARPGARRAARGRAGARRTPGPSRATSRGTRSPPP